MIYESIMNSDINIHQQLYSNIVLSGGKISLFHLSINTFLFFFVGTTKANGIKQRLYQDINQLMGSQNYSTEIINSEHETI